MDSWKNSVLFKQVRPHRRSGDICVWSVIDKPYYSVWNADIQHSTRRCERPKRNVIQAPMHSILFDMVSQICVLLIKMAPCKFVHMIVVRYY